MAFTLASCCSPPPPAAAPSAGPRWQLSRPCEQVSQRHSTVEGRRPKPTRVHSGSGIANSEDSDSRAAPNVPNHIHQLRRLKFCCVHVPGWNTLWCSPPPQSRWGGGILPTYEFEEALLNLLFYCLKVQRSSALRGLSASNNSELWNTESRTEFKLHTLERQWTFWLWTVQYGETGNIFQTMWQDLRVEK